MYTLSGQRVQIGGQGSHQGLALARAHFRDIAVMQDYTADKLLVEVAHLQHAPPGFAHHGKRLWQQRIQRLALADTLLEDLSLLPQLLIRQLRYSGLESVNRQH